MGVMRDILQEAGVDVSEGPVGEEDEGEHQGCG